MFREFFSLLALVLENGGWVLLAWAVLYLFYWLYMDYIHIRWYKKQEWIFLKITVPKENEKSPLAFEQIFNQLHSIHMAITWAEKYLEGQFQIWLTWEITSVGGVIGNYVRILTKYRDNLEAAIYSQYPEAEITEAEDYFQHIPKYDPETSAYDIFGFSLYLIKKHYYPIKTYYAFEHSTTETFVDPIAGMWEELGKITPYEMVVIQYILRPIGDDEWKKPGYELVKKLKGEREALEKAKAPDRLSAWVGKLFGPILDVLIRPTPSPGARREEVAPPSLMLHLSEGEKAVISAVEKKLSKWAYQTKIHFLYLAPKEKYQPGPIRNAVIGAFKSFGATDLNSLKPLLKRWTRVNYLAFEKLERPIVEFRLRWRKRHYMRFVLRRFYWHGPPPVILDVEELASILHFPQTEVKVPHIEKVEVTKVQPPPELPIAQ